MESVGNGLLSEP
ncbi:uncharacterized protein FTOL_13919 [Fusarium torulosum]|uniref:Uncharacterized protein n=1 Tax=Fusarium torulosum TaxID=33205 RepID=A0AAE8MPW4_9HYPO|nr:uncharacterized protein FTOL_13919 [Fusarium torulosum]